MNWSELEQKVIAHLSPILVLLIVAGSAFTLGRNFDSRISPHSPTTVTPPSTPNSLISELEQTINGVSPPTDQSAENSKRLIEPGQPRATVENQQPTHQTIININSASAAQLERLPGIGPVKAQAIISYRTANGPFVRVEDLIKVKGIGPKTLEKIRPLITL